MPNRSARPQGPRVNLTLTPELDRLLDRISAATGTGKATFVREILLGAMPQLEQMASALELVQSKQIPEGLAHMARALRDASGAVEQQELELTKLRRAARRKASG